MAHDTNILVGTLALILMLLAIPVIVIYFVVKFFSRHVADKDFENSLPKIIDTENSE